MRDDVELRIREIFSKILCTPIQTALELKELMAEPGVTREDVLEVFRSWLNSGMHRLISDALVAAGDIPMPELEDDILAVARIPQEFEWPEMIPLHDYAGLAPPALRWATGQASLDYLRSQALLFAHGQLYYRLVAGDAIAALLHRDWKACIAGLRSALECDAETYPGMSFEEIEAVGHRPISMVPLIELLQTRDPEVGRRAGRALSDLSEGAKELAIQTLVYFHDSHPRNVALTEAFRVGLAEGPE